MAQRVRLQVALAQLGFASRRGAIEIIKAGRVKVNARVILQPGERVNLKNDTITVRDESRRIQKKVYFILNKPKGIITTVKDRHARHCVLGLIKQKERRIYPVGRLDKDTTGLLLLTNDGTLTYRLIHPKFGIKKTYRAMVAGCVSQKTLKVLEAGVVVEGRKTFPCSTRLISKTNRASKLEIDLTEGRKRQIKKMFAAFGHPVLELERIAFGPLRLAGLKAGMYRPLKAWEITRLKKAAGLWQDNASLGSCAMVRAGWSLPGNLK